MRWTRRKVIATSMGVCASIVVVMVVVGTQIDPEPSRVAQERCDELSTALDAALADPGEHRPDLTLTNLGWNRAIAGVHRRWAAVEPLFLAEAADVPPEEREALIGELRDAWAASVQHQVLSEEGCEPPS